jgi:hypothetical protein
VLALVVMKSWQPQYSVNQILAGMNVTCGHNIFQYGHTGKQSDVLKCAGNAETGDLVGSKAVDSFAFEMNVAGRRLINSGQ